jgi:AraC-like DNA-binding protein
MLESDRAAALEYERHIIETEGHYHVEGRYFANNYDAQCQRRWTAERMVREGHRQEAVARYEGGTTRPRLSTWLTERERGRVDAATSAQFALTHRDTLHAVRGDLMTGRVDAALVSASLLRVPHVLYLSSIVQDFPGNPVVGLVGEMEEAQALAAALAFGRAGLHALVDVRTVAGWAALRSAFDAGRLHDTFMQRAVRELTSAESEHSRCSAGWTRFLTAAFSPRMVPTKRIAATLGVSSSTLASRFYRAGLPSPKCYVAHARLVWAARLGETPGLTISSIASRLDASSPQSFGRMVRKLVGITAADFRRQFDGAAMLARFRAELVEPYRDRLSNFDPLAPTTPDARQPVRVGSSATLSASTGRAA